jgi:hypothetical protein
LVRSQSEEGAVSEEQVFVDASEDVATPSKPAVAPSEADPLAHYKALALEYFNTAQELANKYAGQAQDVAKVRRHCAAPCCCTPGPDAQLGPLNPHTSAGRAALGLSRLPVAPAVLPLQA